MNTLDPLRLAVEQTKKQYDDAKAALAAATLQEEAVTMNILLVRAIAAIQTLTNSSVDVTKELTATNELKAVAMAAKNMTCEAAKYLKYYQDSTLSRALADVHEHISFYREHGQEQMMAIERFGSQQKEEE